MNFWRKLLNSLLDFLGASTKEVLDHGVDRARKELHDGKDPNQDDS